MTRRRWIVNRVAGDRAYLTGANAAHLTRVLRARVGQEFEIAAGDRVRVGRVASVADEEVEFILGADVPLTEAARTVLLLAIFKFDRMEWAIEKATELGVSEIVPVVARRTDPHLAKAAEKRVERWRRIAREAAQQARRAAPPEISGPVPLVDALVNPAEIKMVLAESGPARRLRELLDPRPVTSNQQPATLLAVGPEGGWTPEELADFARAGWKAASLGNTILRAETAAIAALAVVGALR